MNIGFIAEPYEASGASGMAYMVGELVQGLPTAGHNDQFTIYASQPIKDLPKNARMVRVPKSFLGKFFWFLCTRESIDVLLFVTPLLPLIIPRRIKTVAICPELGSQKIAPRALSGKIVAFIRDHLLMPICLRQARRIVAISQATKDDILTYYSVPPEKVEVIYVGFQDLSQFRSSAPAVPETMQPFFFFTGRVKPRKNVHGVVSGFIRFKKRVPNDCKLVISGKAGGAYLEEMRSALKANGLEHDVFFVGYVPIEVLCSYYLHAIAFVFPSLNEGFGMPVVEAMNLGTPVITSSVSSLPEAAGGAALLVDPYQPEDISQAMERLYKNPILREELGRKGREHAKKFSWPKAACAYIELLHSL